MQTGDNIQYITQAQINRVKWDECITNASNGLIYSYSFYLDYMAEHWDGLVLNDYEAVMPLTWNKKYGIHYLYQPFLTAQLGVFGNHLTKEIIDNFLYTIPSRFSYWDIYLNYQNIFSGNKIKSSIRKNFALHLNTPYEELQKKYSENCIRNIRKSQQAECIPVKLFDKNEVIEMAIKQMSTYIKDSKGNIERFIKLTDFLIQHNQLFTYGIQNSNKELIASCIFLSSHNRYYYILVGNDPRSRDIGASHALIDSFIKDHAEENTILDFEGSDIPGLAKFYSSFGAIEENYPAIRVNKLPFFLRWLKK